MSRNSRLSFNMESQDSPYYFRWSITTPRIVCSGKSLWQRGVILFFFKVLKDSPCPIRVTEAKSTVHVSINGLSKAHCRSHWHWGVDYSIFRNTNNSTKSRRNSKSLPGMSIWTRVSRKKGIKKSYWTVPLRWNQRSFVKGRFVGIWNSERGRWDHGSFTRDFFFTSKRI